MLLAHSETAWGLRLASFELGGSLGIDLNGRRSLGSGYILYQPGFFGLLLPLGASMAKWSFRYEAHWVFFAG